MNRLSFSTHLLEQVVKMLKAEGFNVQVAPLELLIFGIILTAWHPEREEGFFIEPAELGMVARLGLAYLDPYREESSLPRWKREDTPDAYRMRQYAEAVLARACAEVASAPDGVRNQTLSRAAFALGRYLGWGLDESQVTADLEQAGLSSGLPQREVASTVRRGLERGAEAPRDPSELHGDSQGSVYARLKGWR